MSIIKQAALSLLLFFCLSEKAMAQEFNFGLYVGFNASQISGDDLAGFNKFGAYGGLFTGQQLNDDWSWELGLVFSQKGSFRKTSTRQYLLNLGYIEVPFAIRKNTGFMDIDLELGAAFGVLTGYTELAFGANVHDPRQFGRFELSGFLGAHYPINDRAGILVRFTNSILPVREHRSGATYLWNRGQYNTVVSAALRINISH